MLRAADTVGVFQVESRAQMATLPRMRPERFYDLVVEVAIIRPGAHRRQDGEPLPGAGATAAARALSPPFAGADLAAHVGHSPVSRTTDPHRHDRGRLQRRSGRRAAAGDGLQTIGRAHESHRGELRAGMSARESPKAQEEIVQGIKSFALYGFPESHAASFALIAYASAYLKAHHPAAFTCALLNNFPMGFYHPATLVKDAQRHGVACLPVDVTCSQWDCTLEDDRGTTAVRLGLKYLRGLRAEAAQRLVAARPFSSLGDLCRRVELNASERTTLAEVGAFAALGGTRRQVMWQLEAFGRSGELFAGVESGETQTDSPLPEMSPARRSPLTSAARA
jgi:error-prone DNA polymerase